MWPAIAAKRFATIAIRAVAGTPTGHEVTGASSCIVERDEVYVRDRLRCQAAAKRFDDTAGVARLAGVPTPSIANAPCSWGVLEFERPGTGPGYARVLDEMAHAGYAGTELGDWGFMPTEPRALADAVAARGLSLVGAFVTIALADPARHAEGRATAVRTARLLSAASADDPVIVLSDVTAAEETRTRTAGRVGPDSGLSSAQWDAAAGAVDETAAAVRDETGLRTVFHHHCATFVETPAEIEALMTRTDPALVGLCLDTGHATFGGGSPVDLLDRYAARTWHVHFKDCDPAVVATTQRESLDYLAAVRNGVFCELGKGSVDFAAVLATLRRRSVTAPGSSSSRTCCRRWARHSKAPRATGSIWSRSGSDCVVPGRTDVEGEAMG